MKYSKVLTLFYLARPAHNLGCVDLVSRDNRGTFRMRFVRCPEKFRNQLNSSKTSWTNLETCNNSIKFGIETVSMQQVDQNRCGESVQITSMDVKIGDDALA